MVGASGKFLLFLESWTVLKQVADQWEKKCPEISLRDHLYRCRDVMQNLDDVAEDILMHLAG